VLYAAFANVEKQKAHNGETIIEEAEAINKSYPSFL
jgi:5-enolpyruvylshikimate-3-phosphate synthase